MNILFLAPQLPYPPHQGTSLRNFNLIRHIANRHGVSLLAFAQTPEELSHAAPLRQICQQVVTVPAPPPRSPWERGLATLFSHRPDLALRLRSREYGFALERLLGEEHFDVIQVEGLEMAPFVEGLFPRKSPARPLLVYDAHNVEYRLQESIYQRERQEGSALGAFYSGKQWRKLQTYERLLLGSFDRIVAVSQEDAAALRKLQPEVKVTVVPNGVDTELYQPLRNVEEGNILVFTGKMDFRPNVDAMLWFCGRPLRLIRERVGQVQMYIVGQSPSPAVRALERDPGVVVTGWVEEDRDYIARAKVYVVPLHMGGGTRLKVLKAMAMGKAIVATPLACEGLELKGDELLKAEEPIEFAAAVVELWEDVAKRRQLGERGRALVEERYDWRHLVPKLEEVYESRS